MIKAARVSRNGEVLDVAGFAIAPTLRATGPSGAVVDLPAGGERTYFVTFTCTIVRLSPSGAAARGKSFQSGENGRPSTHGRNLMSCTRSS
jgi:hypothetical protein